MAQRWSAWGFIAALVLAAACWGVGAVMGKYALEQVPPLTLLVVQLAVSVALLWALLIWPAELLHGQITRLATIPLSLWAWAAAGGLVYYALAFWLYVIGLKRVPASLAALFLNLIPIFGVSVANLFLSERLTIAQWGGALLILLAVATLLRLQHVESLPATDAAALR